MHRSGTSVLAQCLHEAGIHMGVKKDHNFEAIHFLSLNQQSLWAAGASWLDPKVPEPKNYKLIPADQLYAEHFQINSKITALKHKISPKKWGWKDPRNTFTLPMWLSIYPKAKVIHIMRNSRDIAESLKRRNQIEGEVHDDRLNDLQFNIDLAEKYKAQGRRYAGEMGDRYFELEYEELVKHSKQAVDSLEAFTGVRLKAIIQNLIRK